MSLATGLFQSQPRVPVVKSSPFLLLIQSPEIRIQKQRHGKEKLCCLCKEMWFPLQMID